MVRRCFEWQKLGKTAGHVYPKDWEKQDYSQGVCPPSPFTVWALMEERHWPGCGLSSRVDCEVHGAGQAQDACLPASWWCRVTETSQLAAAHAPGCGSCLQLTPNPVPGFCCPDRHSCRLHPSMANSEMGGAGQECQSMVGPGYCTRSVQARLTGVGLADVPQHQQRLLLGGPAHSQQGTAIRGHIQA